MTALLLGAALLAGCSSDDEGPDELATVREEVSEQLATQAATQAEMNQRIDELEALLQPDEGQPDALSDLTKRLGELEQSLQDAQQQLVQEQGAREDGDASAAAARDALSGSVTELQSTISDLRDRIQLLREDLDSLQAQFRNHSH